MMFTEELELAFGLIEQFPHAGEEIPHRRISPLRQVLLTRSQYHLYHPGERAAVVYGGRFGEGTYTVHVEDGVVEVLALWHTSRGRSPRL